MNLALKPKIVIGAEENTPPTNPVTNAGIKSLYPK